MNDSGDFWKTVIRTGSIGVSERLWLKGMATAVAAQFENPAIVNIGVGWGVSIHVLHAGAPDATLVGVDKRTVAECCTQRLDLLDSVEFILGDSRVCHREFKQPIHLLFIDGGLDCNTVRGDIEGWTPKVAVGGIVVIRQYRRPSNRRSRHCAGRVVEEWIEVNRDSWEELIDARLKAFRRTK